MRTVRHKPVVLLDVPQSYEFNDSHWRRERRLTCVVAQERAPPISKAGRGCIFSSIDAYFKPS